MLKKVGFRPLIQSLTVWVIVGVSTVVLILFNFIRV
jgi:hypothetical protein